MADEKFNITTPLDDEYDTVTYANGKHKKYYNPDTKRYKIMDNRNFAKIWTDVDYYELAEGDTFIMSSILLLLANINYDSAIVRYDKHLRTRVQVRSRKELAELLHINYDNGRSREKLKKLFDIDLIVESTTKLNKGKPFHTYYLNPLIGIRNKGISLDCYIQFRDVLKYSLTNRAIENLDKHVLEEYATSPNILLDCLCSEENDVPNGDN